MCELERGAVVRGDRFASEGWQCSCAGQATGQPHCSWTPRELLVRPEAHPGGLGYLSLASLRAVCELERGSVVRGDRFASGGVAVLALVVTMCVCMSGTHRCVQY